MKKIIVFLVQLLLIVFLSFIARECWREFLQQKENERFLAEGRPVTVQVEKIIPIKRDWSDYLGYGKYIGFHYNGAAYELRYLPDSGWVGTENRVRLLYSTSLDRFLQPSRLRHESSDMKTSPYPGFTIG